MFFKIAILVLNLVLVYAENNCDCSALTFEQSLKESNDIVEFLTKVSEKDGTYDEKYPLVPPGLITGALGCQCENLRKKRKITPSEGIPLVEKNQEEQRTMPKRFYYRGNCAVGRVKINKQCIEIETLY